MIRAEIVLMARQDGKDEPEAMPPLIESRNALQRYAATIAERITAQKRVHPAFFFKRPVPYVDEVRAGSSEANAEGNHMLTVAASGLGLVGAANGVFEFMDHRAEQIGVEPPTDGIVGKVILGLNIVNVASSVGLTGVGVFVKHLASRARRFVEAAETERTVHAEAQQTFRRHGVPPAVRRQLLEDGPADMLARSEIELPADVSREEFLDAAKQSPLPDRPRPEPRPGCRPLEF